MTRGEFENAWDGRIVLMTRRAALGDLGRRFNISWFLGAIRKYRSLLSEVLLASVFLQVFARRFSFKSSSIRSWCIAALAP